MFGQLRQHAARVPFAIDTAGICEHCKPRDLIAKSKSDVAIFVVPIAIKPASH